MTHIKPHTKTTRKKHKGVFVRFIFLPSSKSPHINYSRKTFGTTIAPHRLRCGQISCTPSGRYGELRRCGILSTSRCRPVIIFAPTLPTDHISHGKTLEKKRAYFDCSVVNPVIRDCTHLFCCICSNISANVCEHYFK